MRFLARILTTFLGLWAASNIVAGFSVSGGWKGYLFATLVLAALHLLVRPIFKLISMPLIIATLGLFTIVVNAVILWLASQFTGFIIIDDLGALIWATIIVSIAHLFVGSLK